MEGSEGSASSVKSCGRKDDERQEDHGTAHTRSRKPVNLGKRILCTILLAA
jgi:hypothetical protein